MLTPSQLTRLHRRQQLALRRVTADEVGRIWPQLDWAALDQTYPAFAASVASLVSRNRRTSAGLAAAYLRAFRVAGGLPGDIKIVIPPLAAVQFRTSLEVTSKVAAKLAASRGVPAAVAMGHALTQTSGAMSRLVLNGGRETLTETVKTDPEASGWRRVIGGKGCDFCRVLAGREYPSTTTDFQCHDHCGCGLEPIYT